MFNGQNEAVSGGEGADTLRTGCEAGARFGRISNLGDGVKDLKAIMAPRFFLAIGRVGRALHDTEPAFNKGGVRADENVG